MHNFSRSLTATLKVTDIVILKIILYIVKMKYWIGMFFVWVFAVCGQRPLLSIGTSHPYGRLVLEWNKKSRIFWFGIFFVELARFELASGQNVNKLSTCLVQTWFSAQHRRFYLPMLRLVSEFCIASETIATLFQFGYAQSDSIGKTILRYKGQA